MRRRFVAGGSVAVVGLLVLLLMARPWAQTAAVPAGDVIGAGNFIHIVGDVDRSVAFYQNVLGMDLQRGGGARGNAPAGAVPPAAPAAPPAPPAAPRQYGGQAEIMRLYNAVDIQYRLGAIMVGDWPMRAEQIDWNDASRKPIQPRYQDPGASTLVLTVRSLDTVLARVKAIGAPIVTAGGAPVSFSEDGTKVRAVLVKDPDGFFVELVERDPAPPTTATSVSMDGNLIGVGFAFTVSDTDRMMRVFKDALGFAPETSAFLSDKARLDLMATPGAQYRRTTATVPGSSLRVEFFEFRGIDRKPVQSTTRDPGTPVLRLRVRDIDTTLKSLGAAGVKVWSAGGEPVFVGNANGGQRFAITSAPDNLYIQVVQQVQRAP